MCQNKKLQLDIVSMLVLNKALELIRQQALKNKYVLTLGILAEYYTMPLIECIISPEVRIVAVCPVTCRGTGKQDEFVTHMGNLKFSVTHPRKDLLLKCPTETLNLTITSDIGSIWLEVPCGCRFQDDSNSTVHLTYRSVDKSIVYNQKQQFPGLTLSAWGAQLLQFDNLYSCLDYDRRQCQR
ncbi:hypothetical protein FQR65_LT00543 [Abscondita terminalis]|nr:hypothetical protein FQR65_LT00543 [Abscondita terminalis]